MPAGSDVPPDRPAVPALPHTWRPFGPRIAAAVFAVVLVGAFVFLWQSFDDRTRESVNVVQRATVVGFIGVGLALLFALARSKVVATDGGLRLVNGYRRRSYEWAEVIAIRMPPGAPWPTVDLADGTTVSAMGIHGSDGTRARTAVRELKLLLATH